MARLCGVVALVGALAACATRPTPQLTTEQFDRLQKQIAAADPAQAAPAPSPTPASGGSSAGAATETARPPRTDAQRRARAAAALAPNVTIVDLEAVGDGTRWVVALVRTASAGGAVPRLVLIDVSREKGMLIGDHGFDVELEHAGMPAPTGIGRAFSLDARGGDPVVLAELRTGEGDGTTLGLCGWALAPRLEFVCAPRVGPGSRWETHAGALVESWTVDSLGARVGGESGATSGRVLVYADGRWHEVDHFRCLGKPLPAAFTEAGEQGLATWQRETVRRLTLAAKRASDALDTDVAISRLRDALQVDGCAPDVWRILGRLEFQAGRPTAAATLAVAAALAPRDDAVVLELADALAVLDVARPEQRDAWHTAVAVLGERSTTRALVQGPGGKSPRALALALYRAFLERTSPADERLRPRRQRVERKIEELEARR
ncbi:MAG TPA: hypothetical protein VIS07_15120 [Candidatus Binatia bacterium]